MSIDNIPVIDIVDLGDPATLGALDAACREWGFFQVVNHGIASATIIRLMRESRAFFAEPPRVKRAISRTAESDKPCWTITALAKRSRFDCSAP